MEKPYISEMCEEPAASACLNPQGELNREEKKTRKKALRGSQQHSQQSAQTPATIRALRTGSRELTRCRWGSLFTEGRLRDDTTRCDAAHLLPVFTVEGGLPVGPRLHRAGVCRLGETFHMQTWGELPCADSERVSIFGWSITRIGLFYCFNLTWQALSASLCHSA